MCAHAAVEKRITYEKMLAEISEHAVRVEDIGDFLRFSIKKMGEILDVSRVFVFKHTNENSTFSCVCGWDSPEMAKRRSPDNFILNIPWAAEQLSRGNIINQSDIKNIPGKCYRAHLVKEKIRSTLNVPLFIRGKLYGFVGFDEHRHHRKWQNEDLYILTTAAQIIVRTIENKEYEEELKEHKNMLESIFSSVQDAIITVNTSFVVIESNKAAKTICDIEKMPGRPMTECMRGCSGNCLEVLQTTLREKCIIHERQIKCGITGDQGRISMVNCSPLLSGNGSFLGAVLVIRDITRLTRLENVLSDRQYYQGMIGKSEKMQQIYQLLKRLTDMPTTVLITGESGTGKERVAHALHYGGQRADKPFIKVNCSALAESLLETELFGHVRGAFTGADKDAKGRFQAADGGTILLDEIGDISVRLQLKLLRVLQEKEFERVGEHVPRKIDVRIIASTNRNLKKAISDGHFREDLYYRLNVVNVEMPPLRERLEDIPLLADHFCMLFSKHYSREINAMAPEVLAAFMAYPWPGNVRELEHAIERAFVLCRWGVIKMEHIPAEIREYAQRRRPASLPARMADSRDAVQEALKLSGWNVAGAARMLGISRWTLYRRLEEFNLQRDRRNL